MKHLSTGLLVVVAAIAVGTISPTVGRADSASPAPSPTASAGPGSEASAPWVVDTKNFTFVPATVTVHVGDSVTFKNSDSVAHTVTAGDKSFDSGNMDPGATWSHVFKAAGTYAYVCAYHTYMRGTVVVK